MKPSASIPAALFASALLVTACPSGSDVVHVRNDDRGIGSGGGPVGSSSVTDAVADAGLCRQEVSTTIVTAGEVPSSSGR